MISPLEVLHTQEGLPAILVQFSAKLSERKQEQMPTRSNQHNGFSKLAIGSSVILYTDEKLIFLLVLLSKSNYQL